MAHQEFYPNSWRDADSTFRMPAVIRGVGRWIFLAIVLSISVHFLLYLAIVELPLGDFLARASAWKEKRVQGPRERIQISPDLLSETIPLPAMATHQTETEIRETDLTMVDQELDLLDAQENMPEKEVRLTPEVSDIHNFLKGEGSASAAAAASVSLVDALEAVATTASESLVTEDVSEIRRVMLEARGAVSENQLLLDISQLEEGTSPPDEDLFADLTAAQRAVSGGVPQLEGFDTLDNLLGRAGRLPGNLKPVLMPTDLLFGYNEDTLADSARLSLMKLGLLIQRNPESEFIIEGHTDSFGNDDYNLELSIRRATAVRDWLARSLRLSIDGIRIRGYGESRPLVDPEGSREAQQLNRRVEIVIRPKA